MDINSSVCPTRAQALVCGIGAGVRDIGWAATGAVSGAVTFATLGLWQADVGYAGLRTGGSILSDLTGYVIKVMDPKAHIPLSVQPLGCAGPQYKNCFGLFANAVHQGHLAIMIGLKDKHFIVKQVVALLTEPLLLISYVAARALDGVIGVFALTAALLTVGRNPELNRFTYRQLQMTQVIADLFLCTVRFVNVYAFKSEVEEFKSRAENYEHPFYAL